MQKVSLYGKSADYGTFPAKPVYQALDKESVLDTFLTFCAKLVWPMRY